MNANQAGSDLVIGAGVIGSRVARMLAEDGHRVSVVSRRGSGPAGVTHLTADAADAEAMVRLAEGATVIYNCVNPAYHRWPTDWPPIAASLLGAAERSGAVLVTLSNLYGYGPAARSLEASAYDRAHPMTTRLRSGQLPPPAFVSHIFSIAGINTGAEREASQGRFLCAA